MNMSLKIGKMLVEPKHLALGAVFIVSVVILALSGLIKENKVKSEPTPSTLTWEKIVDSTEGGIYTNYTYKFKFDYPEYVFKYSSLEIDEQTNKQDRSFLTEQFIVIPYLRVVAENVSHISQSNNENFNEIASLNTGERKVIETENSRSETIKLSQIHEGTMSGFTYYHEGYIEDTEPNFNYNLLLKDNDKMIHVTLEIIPSDKEVFEKIFDEIVESFKPLD